MDDFARIFAFFEECSLTWYARQLISELYPLIRQNIENFKRTRSRSWPRYDTSYSITRDISDYREKIDRIVEVLDSSYEKRETFLRNFSSWETQRLLNIEILRKIEEKMKDVRQVSNVVKIAAGSVGVVGGAAIIGSLLFPPAAPALLPAWLGGAAASALLPSVFMGAAPVVSSLAVAGGAAAAGGAVVNVGANITELVLTGKCLDEVKEIIEQDRRLLKELGVFEFFDKLNSAIDDLFGKSTSSEILDHLIDFLKKIPPTLVDIQPIQKALSTCLQLILPGITKFLLVGVSLASVVLSIFFVVFMIRRFGCTILNHRLALGLGSAVNASVEITRLIGAAGLTGSELGELIPRQLAGKIAVGAMAGVGIVLDVATIVVSSIDLADGSLSDEAKMISAVAKNLKSHLSSYQEVNDDLQRIAARRLRRNDVTNWTAVIVNHVPLHANQEDITTAFRQYFHDEAWDCVILERLPTDRNHWLVKVPTSHAQMLLGQTYINIKRERCLIMQ